TDIGGTALAVQSDDKVICAGGAFNGSNNDIGVRRFNTDGSLDTSFDGDGLAMIDLGGNEGSNGVTIDSNGTILVASQQDNIALVRLNTDGSLDTTFDGDGIVITNASPFGSDGRSIVVQNDGKIVVAGVSNQSDHTAVLVVRYNDDGSLDTSFDVDGIVTTS